MHGNLGMLIKKNSSVDIYQSYPFLKTKKSNFWIRNFPWLGYLNGFYQF